MSGLCTDLYEIRMAASYLERNMTAPATFSLFSRKLPPDRGFLVSAGLADCLDFLEHFHFDADECAYLEEVVGLPESALARLADLRFTGDVWAVPEGRVVFGGEPFLEVTAPFPEAQLVETALLNFVTYQSSVAAKAARFRIAAPRADLVDFAARRTHGLEAAMAVARASSVVGFAGTSYVAGARRFGLRALGTMAHSYVEAFEEERAAFRAFAEDFPESMVFLVDTYDTLAGVRAAIDVARETEPPRHIGIRLDSGDLGALALESRRLLDEAGLTDALIMASGGLDEHRLGMLTAARAPIDVYGIGTRMGVSFDAPSLDSAYKLVEYDSKPMMKLSSGKLTAPGAKQIHRGPEGDLLSLRDEKTPAGREPLLQPVMRAGARLNPPEPVAAARGRFEQDLRWLPEQARRLHEPVPVEVDHSSALRELTESRRRALSAGSGVPGRA